MGFIYGTELFEYCKKKICELQGAYDSPFKCGQIDAYLDVMKMINLMPEATRIVDSGHWSSVDDGCKHYYLCSNCGFHANLDYAYCPHCGAEMGEEDDKHEA